MKQRHLQGNPGFRYMILLGIMAAGFSSVELITNNMIPITLRHFTDSAFLIAAVLATNRLFGFVVQPFVCWKSDFVRTRFGRRRPFMMFGLPATFVAVLLVGTMPFLIQGDARQTLMALFILVVVNVFMQAVVDVNWGVLEPLYADTFHQQQLGRASSIRQILSQLVNLLMVYFVLGWADLNEFYPYLFSAGCVALSFIMILFVIREKEVDYTPPKARYSPVKHIGLLVQNSDYAKLAFICAANLVLPATLLLFTSLHATTTIGLTLGQFGKSQVLGPVIVLALAFPIGLSVDWIGPKWMMAFGFFLYLVCFNGMAFWAHDFTSIFVCMTIFGVAQVVALMPMTAMVFQYTSNKERGQVFGLVQFVRAFSAFVLSLILGVAVQLAVTYDNIPIYEGDIKKAQDFADRLSPLENPVKEFIRENLSQDSLNLALKNGALSAAELAALSKSLGDDFERLINGPSIYIEQRFAKVSLSERSQNLVKEAPPGGEPLAALNGSLLQDVFPKIKLPIVEGETDKARRFVDWLNPSYRLVAEFVRDGLSAETIELTTLEKGLDKDQQTAFRDALAADFNKLINGPSIYDEQRFAKVELSSQTKKLLEEAPAEGDRLVVLNRCLLQDAFPKIMSKKINYRFSYYIGILLSIAAIWVALMTRRGEFAHTLADGQHKSEALE